MKRFHKLPLSSTNQRDEILFPKRNNLVGLQKPITLILNSPFDAASDFATRYKDVEDFLLQRGYSVANLNRIVFSLNIEEFQSASVKLVNYEKISPLLKNANSITIWLEAHGAPGWMFGPGNTSSPDPAAHPNHITENRGIVTFSQYMLELEKKINIPIKNVVLNSCFSGFEVVNPAGDAFINSSARLLSILLPDKNVIGFIAFNSGAKVTNISEFDPSKLAGAPPPTTLVLPDNSLLQPITISTTEGAVIFKNGKVVERGSKNLFYKPDAFIQPFITKSSGIAKTDQEYFKICSAKEEVEKMRKIGAFSSDECFADKQLRLFSKKRQQLFPELEGSESKEAGPSSKP